MTDLKGENLVNVNLGEGQSTGAQRRPVHLFFLNLTLYTLSACSTLVTCVESGIVRVWRDNDKEASSDPVSKPLTLPCW